jgi:carbohydrate kinase (thermoresistant glucokinase family)
VVILLMSVSGAGKTTIGKRLAHKLGWQFFDGDDVHPTANIEKMRHGIPLSDADRRPWLEAVRALIEDAIKNKIDAGGRLLRSEAILSRAADRKSGCRQVGLSER